MERDEAVDLWNEICNGAGAQLDRELRTNALIPWITPNTSDVDIFEITEWLRHFADAFEGE